MLEMETRAVDWIFGTQPIPMLTCRCIGDRYPHWYFVCELENAIWQWDEDFWAIHHKSNSNDDATDDVPFVRTHCHHDVQFFNFINIFNAETNDLTWSSIHLRDTSCDVMTWKYWITCPKSLSFLNDDATSCDVNSLKLSQNGLWCIRMSRICSESCLMKWKLEFSCSNRCETRTMIMMWWYVEFVHFQYLLMYHIIIEHIYNMNDHDDLLEMMRHVNQISWVSHSLMSYTFREEHEHLLSCKLNWHN